MLEDPNDFLTHNLDNGEIISKESEPQNLNNKRAAYTVKILNLNEKSLKNSRKTWIDQMNAMRLSASEAEMISMLDMIIAQGESFPNLSYLFLEILKRSES